MNAIIRESPAIYFEGKAREPDQVMDEVEWNTSFFEFRVFLPSGAVPSTEEMSDADLLAAAEAAGTFRFMDEEGEDAYQP